MPTVPEKSVSYEDFLLGDDEDRQDDADDEAAARELAAKLARKRLAPPRDERPHLPPKVP